MAAVTTYEDGYDLVHYSPRARRPASVSRDTLFRIGA